MNCASDTIEVDGSVLTGFSGQEDVEKTEDDDNRVCGEVEIVVLTGLRQAGFASEETTAASDVYQR